VLPGRKMAGHMGVQTKTIRNLEVVAIDKDQSLVMVRGSVPGNTRGKIVITKA
jgi:large subunit ribosomal protein L3